MKEEQEENLTPVERSELLTSVTMMNNILRDMTPCSLVDIDLHFGETYRLYSQSRREKNSLSYPEDGSVVGIDWLLAGRLRSRSSSPGEVKIFSSPNRPDRLWGPPNVLSTGYRFFFLGVKRPGREADNSPPTSDEVKKMWIHTSTPPYAFMA
jgi:hypothetical protein